MRILFIVPYPKNCAPSQRLKFEQYYTIFQENGIELKHSSFYSESMWKVLYRKGYIFNKIICLPLNLDITEEIIDLYINIINSTNIYKELLSYYKIIEKLYFIYDKIKGNQ